MTRRGSLPSAAGLTMACLLLAGPITGCTSEPEMSAREWASIETREFDAPAAQVLPSAAAVLLDEGFLLTMSDHEAGLLGGESMGRSNATDVENYARRGGLGNGSALGEYAVVWVRPLSPARSEMRLRLTGHGHLRADREQVSHIWERTQRRLLALAPTRGG